MASEVRLVWPVHLLCHYLGEMNDWEPIEA